MMPQASDAFVAVPGGFGTMEKLTHGSIDLNVEIRLEQALK
jgi:predicted Rossmann-fold nucleotide-binding protein